MKRLFYCILGLILCQCNLTAQERTYVTETEDYIAWQPGVKLTFDMFKKVEPTEWDTINMKRENRQSMPYLGYYHVLDVPKKVSRKGGWKDGLGEKAYFCAMFSKHQSYMAVRDSFELKVSQALWDIVELSVRCCRRGLDHYQKMFDKDIEGHTTGVVAMFFYAECKKWEETKNELSLMVIKDVVIPHDYDRYLEIRKELDEMLDSTALYASTPEEAERFLLNKPLDDRYKMAEQLIDMSK